MSGNPVGSDDALFCTKSPTESREPPEDSGEVSTKKNFKKDGQLVHSHLKHSKNGKNTHLASRFGLAHDWKSCDHIQKNRIVLGIVAVFVQSVIILFIS